MLFLIPVPNNNKMSLLLTLINGSSRRASRRSDKLEKFNRFEIKDGDNNHVCDRDDKELMVYGDWKFKCYNQMIMFININQVTEGDYPHVTCSFTPIKKKVENRTDDASYCTNVSVLLF